MGAHWRDLFVLLAAWFAVAAVIALVWIVIAEVKYRIALRKHDKEVFTFFNSIEEYRRDFK